MTWLKGFGYECEEPLGFPMGNQQARELEQMLRAHPGYEYTRTESMKAEEKAGRAGAEGEGYGEGSGVSVSVSVSEGSGSFAGPVAGRVSFSSGERADVSWITTEA